MRVALPASVWILNSKGPQVHFCIRLRMLNAGRGVGGREVVGGSGGGGVGGGGGGGLQVLGQMEDTSRKINGNKTIAHCENYNFKILIIMRKSFRLVWRVNSIHQSLS